ncbi:MAG: MFS transporter [Steroidobacteraceae bacterium]|jgi:DHA1 family tetracycline resistance protein-like MFS transporter|nr:MFS transporter [Gammaproteobacteria bacterium]
MTKSLGLLWLVVFISLAGFGITTIPFPIVVEQMGASDFWKTFGGAGVFSLFQLVATPFWGRCSDAWGRKPILVFSLAGSVLAYLWLAYAPSLESLLVSRAFGGIMSGNLAAAFAYATDVTEPKDRAKGLGIVASAFGVGFAIGPALGGFLGTIGGEASLHWPGLASAALSLLALVGTMIWLPESLPESLRRPFGRASQAGQPTNSSLGEDAGQTSEQAPTKKKSMFDTLFSRPVLLGLVGTSLIVAVAAGTMQSVYQFWARDLFGYSLVEVGLHFTVFALLSAVGQAGLIGPLTRRFGERPIAIASVIGVVIGLVLFATAVNPLMVWLAIGVFGLANGLYLPAISSLVSFEADPRSRGSVMGAFNASSSAGRIIGPALSGPVYFKLGPAAPFVMSAGLTALGAILLVVARAKSR